MMHLRSALLLAALLAITACGDKPKEEAAPADASYQDELQSRLLDAQPGEIIDIPEGVFSFDRSLSLTVSGVTIRGAGMDKTVLSFKGQVAGAEGLIVTADDFTIEDLAIEDTKGDGLKVNEGENIAIRRVRVEWSGGPKTENGAYGLYPVQSKNVLIEDSLVIGASDAGIYVGQSQYVVVRNNRAERNVAGIEIENTYDADVYGNVATENTGGILVFNLPNLSQFGARTRVYGNKVFDNNTRNFGAPGTAVASIPAGSGVVVNSNDYVEIFDNDITGNKTANIIISSLFSSGLAEGGMDEAFDPYPEAIYVHGNRLSDGGRNPDGLDLQALKIAKFGPTGALPDILWDGYVDPAKLVDGELPAELRICVQNDGAEILDGDIQNGSKNPRLVGAEHDCALAKLPPVELPDGFGE